MSNASEDLQGILDSLAQQRDQLKLKMHLASLETRDEWEKLEARYQELSRELDPTKRAVEDTADNIAAGLKLTADEIRAGFARIIRSL